MRQTGWGYAYAHRHGTCVLLGGAPIPLQRHCSTQALSNHEVWTRQKPLARVDGDRKAAIVRGHIGREADGTTTDFAPDGPGPTPPRVAPDGPRRQCRPVHLGAVSSPGPLGSSHWATQAWRYPARARPGSAAL